MPAGPLLSIVIPVYNGADFLREAIDSALAQTYPNVEVVVVDDGSDDGGATGAIARDFGDRIRYLRKGNGGVASALNLGIREMRGEYFSWLSHDDLFLPEKSSLQIAALERERGDVVLYSDYEVMDGGGRSLGTFRAGEIPPAAFRRALAADAPVNGCTILAPKRLLERAGGFDERLRTTQDYDLWFRMAGSCRFVHMPVPLIRSRTHAGQGTRTMASDCLAEGNALFLRFLDELASTPGESASLDGFLLYAAVRLNQRGYLEASRKAYSMHLRRACAGRGIIGWFRGASAALVYRLLDRRPFRGLVASRLRQCAYSS